MPAGRNVHVYNVTVENFDDALCVKPLSGRSGVLAGETVLAWRASARGRSSQWHVLIAPRFPHLASPCSFCRPLLPGLRVGGLDSDPGRGVDHRVGAAG